MLWPNIKIETIISLEQACSGFKPRFYVNPIKAGLFFLLSTSGGSIRPDTLAANYF